MNTSTSTLLGRHISCILFDLGYTIWDRRRNSQLWDQVERASNRQAIVLLLQRLAPELLPPDDDDVLGVRLREMFDEHEHDIIRRDTVREPDGPLAVLRTLNDWSIENADGTLCRSVFEALNVRIPDSFPLLEDAIPTLTALRERGYCLGIVTNRMWGGEAFREDLRTLGLLNYFDERGIAISAEVGIRKPAPALFWHALHGLQATPEQTAMVGDSLRTDILGAQKLGLFTVWLPRAKQRERVKEYQSTLSASPAHQMVSPQVKTPLPSSEEAADDTSFYDEDYLPANMPGRDGYLERFLRGEIKPDLIIDKAADLLDVFVTLT